ncbi:MAG: hypothetical protein HY261_01810 [Chloroflexi bacterium]|nr:hypothetical protein [Chloroflexota bacterium]
MRLPLAIRLPRRLLTASLLLLPLLLLLASCGGDKPGIAIIEPWSGSDITGARNAFLQTLKDANFKAAENARFFVFNAQTQQKSLDELAQHVADESHVQYVLAFGARALDRVKASTQKQVVYLLAYTPANPGGSRAAGPSGPAGPACPVPPCPTAGPTTTLVTRSFVGISATAVSKSGLGVLAESVSGLRRVAVIYEKADPDSLVSHTDLSAEVLRFEVSTGNDVSHVAKDAIAQGAQAITVTPSVLLGQHFSDILNAAGSKVPVIGWSQSQVEDGALLAVGPDPESQGQKAAKLMLRLLRGEAIQNIQPITDNTTLTWVNQKIAARLGITLPPDVVAGAAKVVK